MTVMRGVSKTFILIFYHNFDEFRSILQILSPSNSQEKFLCK